MVTVRPMGSARLAVIAFAGGFVAMPISSVGASSVPEPEPPPPIDQIVPAIEAVRTEVGADVSICEVRLNGQQVWVGATEPIRVPDDPGRDGDTYRLFRYEHGSLSEENPFGEHEGCAPVDEVLAFDIDIFHEFLAEHPDANFEISSYTGEVFLDGEIITYNGEPIYFASVFNSDGFTLFELDPHTGETVSAETIGEVVIGPGSSSVPDADR
jgi:hypothetical protein